MPALVSARSLGTDEDPVGSCDPYSHPLESVAVNVGTPWHLFSATHPWIDVYLWSLCVSKLTVIQTNHHLRSLSLQPILQHTRLHRVRYSLPTLLLSPSRPTLSELIARHIFLTHTTQISRRLARSLVAIRLSRRLPLRPSAETLVQRGVLPGECVEGMVAPGLVAKKRAVERERLKDGLRRWVGGVWKGEVRQRSEGIRKWEESRGVGRVWRLRRFWEHVSRGGDELR